MNREPMAMSAYQRAVNLQPEEWDIFLGGGRGGAKSYALVLLAMRHAEQYGNKARILYVRQSYKGLADFEALTREVFGQVWGQTARYNASEHVWRLPDGAYMELGQIADAADYQKYQGRSFTLLLVDEAGQYSSPELLDRLRSNLRGPKSMPIRMAIAANPGGPGHHWLAQRYVFKAEPWEPFTEEKSRRVTVYAPSTFLDNPFIDQDEYRAQLEASCPADPELLRAWLEGDWAVARGAFFASVIEEKRNAIDPWPVDWHREKPKPLPRDFRSGSLRYAHQATNNQGRGWSLYLAHDYGSAAPSVTFVMAESPGAEGPGGEYYPVGSVVILDELATNEPGHLDKGMGYTIPHLAEQIKDLAARWGMPRAEGVADDACFAKHGHSTGSIAEELKQHGVYFYPAHKADRMTGWEIMRRLLSDAGKPDVPGLYVSRACEYFWSTVPYLGRDPRRVEDLDTRQPDHAADACRYGLLRRERRIKRVKLGGL